MITQTAKKHLVRAIKTRLGINDRWAGAILDNNWFSLPSENLRGVVVILQNTYVVNPYLDIYVPNEDGYYGWVGSLRLEKKDLTRWNVMSLEEAYALPDDFKTVADSYEWVDGIVTDAKPRDEDAIIVTVTTKDGQTRDMAMLAEINDAQGLIRYVREKLNEESRLCIEETPDDKRAAKAGGLPVLEMIVKAQDFSRCA